MFCIDKDNVSIEDFIAYLYNTSEDNSDGLKSIWE